MKTRAEITRDSWTKLSEAKRRERIRSSARSRRRTTLYRRLDDALALLTEMGYQCTPPAQAELTFYVERRVDLIIAGEESRKKAR